MSGELLNPKTAMRVSAILGDRVICARCGATLATYADRCTAELDDCCEGFQTIELALAKPTALESPDHD